MLRIVTIRIFFVLVMLCLAHQSHAFTCFGKLPTDAQVCGGNGLCKAQDSCECLDLSYGNYMHSSINGTISNGVSIWNPQKTEFLILQSDGNLALYFQPTGVADWAEGYNPNQYPNYIKLESSGGLTLVNSYNYVYKRFSTGCSGGIGPFRLVVRSDRNFAVYDSVGKQCWAKQLFPTAPAYYYGGPNCDQSVCFYKSGASACSSQGTCVSYNKCKCNDGYYGDACEYPYYCFGNSGSSACSGKGVCVAPNECTCQSGWKGSSDCSSYSCDDSTLNNCSYSLGRGFCSSSNKCTCNPGFTGLDCSTAEEKKFTLQGSMYVAGYDWSPQSSFKAGDRVFVNVQSSNVNSFISRLIVNDAFLCCFKETVYSLNYNPSLGQYGCTIFNSTSMDVQQSVISNNVGNLKVSTYIYPQGSNYVSTFSFSLNPYLFPLATSQSAKSCFIQTNIGLASLTRSVKDKAEGVVISNFVFLTSPPRTVSSAQSNSCAFQFIFTLAVLIVSLIL